MAAHIPQAAKAQKLKFSRPRMLELPIVANQAANGKPFVLACVAKPDAGVAGLALARNIVRRRIIPRGDFVARYH